MSARSGAISDLNNLVNEAKSAATGTSGGEQRGGAPPSAASIATSGRSSISSGSRQYSPNNNNNNNDSNGSVADDASLSSFTRSVARVARAAVNKDAPSVNSNMSNMSSSIGSSRRGRGPPPPPPPLNRPYSIASSARSSHGGSQPSYMTRDDASFQGLTSTGSSSNRSQSTSTSSTNMSRTSNRSGQSNATNRLMSLVNELSQPKPPSNTATASLDPSVSLQSSGNSGYLPNQYSNNNPNPNQRPSPPSRDPSSNSRSGSSSASSRAAGSTLNSSSLEPTGYVMPPLMVGGSASYISGDASTMASNSMYSGSTGNGPSVAASAGGQSMYSGASRSMMSGTSAGESTIHSEFSAGFVNRPNSDANSFATQSQSQRPSVGSVLPPTRRESHGSSHDSSHGSAPSNNNSYGSRRMVGYDHGNNDPSVAGDSFASPHNMDGEYTMDMKNGSLAGGSQYSQSQGSIAGASQYSQSQQSSVASSAASQYSQIQSEYQYSQPQYSQNQSQFSPIPNPYNQLVPGMDMSFAPSVGTRSLANSAALIPKAHFSWASETVGTQSTMGSSRRSLNSTSVPTPHHDREGNKVREGRLWASFAWIITFPIPNKCIMRPTKDAKQAWREKVALFIMMVSCSVFFVGVFGFVPLLLCKEDTVFSMGDIWLQSGENWVVVHGKIYDVKDLIYRHPGGVDGIVDYLGKDGSKVFPRAPPVTLPPKCMDMEKVQAYSMDVYTPENNFTNPSCSSFSELDLLLGVTCHTFAAGSNGTAKFLGDYERGVLSHTSVGLNEQGIQWLALYDRVYDVSTYIKAINENQEPTKDGESGNLDSNPAAYLTPTLNKVIMNSLGGDATDLYEALFGSSEYIACLEEMFYHGLLDDEFDSFCYTLNIMMYVMLVFVATLMVIQFIASMIYICPRHRTYSEEDVMSPVMIMVPCYNEGDNELRKTIKSVLNTTYPDENKVLFMVADGVVTGDGEDRSTPEHLANILGFDIDEFEDDTFEYDCIGVAHTKNRARVYHGILQKGHKFLKYITVVKSGLPEEARTSPKPGNRGKRDSQLVIMGYYNRIHYGRELTELDSAVQRAMVDLNLQADMVRFLMAIDADTRVDDMSITHMVYAMDKKEKVLALCGETKVDNKASSWVCMIQVFEYYNSHHLKKAFEAAFGCVTCLPGCFTMYRIIADDGTPLLPGDGVLYEYSRNDVETLHEKNLYHLGEDRMLTTLLLKYYPDRSLTFIPEAICWTIVPHTFRILLSQRRRWINSTVHNMFELLRVNTMCGVCCVSMKVVVFIDLIATMILPASYVYAMYLLFLVFFEDLPVSTVLLILYGIIMGVQIVVFILRSRWEYCWWFFVYFVVGLPVFYLILPTYAFWNMDDFSWGKTRSVGGSANALGGGAGALAEDNDDDEYKEKEYDNLITDGTNAPRGMQDDDMRSTSSSSRGSASDDDDGDRSNYDSQGSASDDDDGDRSNYDSRGSASDDDDGDRSDYNSRGSASDDDDGDRSDSESDSESESGFFSRGSKRSLP